MFDAQNDYGITVRDLVRYPMPTWKGGISAEAMTGEPGII